MAGNRATYGAFLEAKRTTACDGGINVRGVGRHLYPFQKHCVKWACKLGKAAIFADCGLGKTPMQIEWARQMIKRGGRALIVAPLAVSQQTHLEGEKFGVEVCIARKPSELGAISITNYEMLEHFAGEDFTAVVLDESSILKNFAGQYRQQITDFCARIPYRLACTATPAPNDYVEIGTHSEFLGALSRVKMLSRYFVNDSSDTGTWRLKGHAEEAFWEWMRSWCIAFRKPSDIGFSDDGFDLPALQMHEHVVAGQHMDGYLFDSKSKTLAERRAARRDSLDERVARAASIANKGRGPYLIWCNLNSESTALTKAIRGAVEVAGSTKKDAKESAMMDFARGKIRALVTKPSIAGFGMNWQACASMLFVGLSDSWEQYYQAVRRCWRFGQTRRVHVHIIISDAEGDVLSNIRRKEGQASSMFDRLVASMTSRNERTGICELEMELPTWIR